MEKGKHIKRIIAVVVFIALFILSYQTISWVLQVKIGQDDRIHTFYHQPKDSLDVVFVGSSHVYYGVSPMQLWNDYGFTSYDAASPSQAIPASYYLIRDVIRTQHPRLIVLDAYYMTYDTYSRSQSYLHELTDSMGLFSPNRYAAINDLAPKCSGSETVWSFYFNIAYYHSRWQELTMEDLFPSNLFLKGANLNNEVAPVYPYEPLEQDVALPEVTVEYLAKIQALCEENDTDLLLVSIPYTKGKSKKETMQKQLAMYWTLEGYADEHGLAYLHFSDINRDSGLDASQDYYEPAHLNIRGAAKVTDYLGAYLTEHYDLPDHRGDPAYESWDEDYRLYADYLAALEAEMDAAVEG